MDATNSITDEELEKCLADHDYLAKKYFFNKKYCMSYDVKSCKGDIIRAHTISDKYIRNLGNSGNVYFPIFSSYNKKGLYELRLTGINKATVITGFCKHHDEVLFSSFEKTSFDGAYNQIYDITFRALCREYYQKKCIYQFFSRVSSEDLGGLDRRGYTKSDHFKKARMAENKELRDHKFLYDQLKKIKDTGLSYLVIEVSKIPILTTGIIFPLVDPCANVIQGQNGRQLGFIYNLITLKSMSYIILSTAPTLHNNAHKNFLNSLASIKSVKLINYLLTYFFLNNDNMVIDPNWFDSLSPKVQCCLVNLLNFQVGNYYAGYCLDRIIEFDRFVDFSYIKITSEIK